MRVLISVKASYPSVDRNTAPAGALIEIRPRRPLRPTKRATTRTPSTSTVRDWPSAYQSAASPVSDPVEPSDIQATHYHCLALDPRQPIYDELQRPFPISESPWVIATLGRCCALPQVLLTS